MIPSAKTEENKQEEKAALLPKEEKMIAAKAFAMEGIYLGMPKDGFLKIHPDAEARNITKDPQVYRVAKTTDSDGVDVSFSKGKIVCATFYFSNERSLKNITSNLIQELGKPSLWSKGTDWEALEIQYYWKFDEINFLCNFHSSLKGTKIEIIDTLEIVDWEKKLPPPSDDFPLQKSEKSLPQPEKLPLPSDEVVSNSPLSQRNRILNLSTYLLEEKLSLQAKGFNKETSQDSTKSPWIYKRSDSLSRSEIIINGNNSVVLYSIEAIFTKLDDNAVDNSASSFLGTIATLGFDSERANEAKEWVIKNTGKDSEVTIGKLRLQTAAPQPNKRVLRVTGVE
jgi:hypothetical protein